MTKIDQLGQGLATTKPAAQDRRARGLSMCSPMFPPFSVGQIGVPWFKPKKSQEVQIWQDKAAELALLELRGGVMACHGLGHVSAKLPSYNQPQPAMDIQDASIGELMC